MVQKLPDPVWQAETKEIYATYDMFHQGDGADQKVRDPDSGKLVGRCQLICQRLSRSARPQRILDIGCGTGVFLEACSEIFPEAELYGYDLDGRAGARLSGLAGFRRLFTGGLSRISGQFSLVALIHSLEHLPDPLEGLARVAKLIEPGGRLLIQVPDSAASPLDLVVADHLSHFDSASLARLLTNAGFELESGPTNWVKKELSVTTTLKANGNISDTLPLADAPIDLDRQLEWLQSFAERCGSAASARPFGIFGTSIAAAWLTGQAGMTVDFFLDEDTNRIGRTFMGRPIMAPTMRPQGSTVYIGLQPAVASAVSARLDRRRGDVLEPPPLD